MICYLATEGQLKWKNDWNGLYALLHGENHLYEFYIKRCQSLSLRYIALMWMRYAR